MIKKKVYIAFDYDDLGVKSNLIAESKQPETATPAAGIDPAWTMLAGGLGVERSKFCLPGSSGQSSLWRMRSGG
jgi:hypothetical protein